MAVQNGILLFVREARRVGVSRVAHSILYRFCLKSKKQKSLILPDVKQISVSTLFTKSNEQIRISEEASAGHCFKLKEHTKP